jgi:hypothetical protein
MTRTITVDVEKGMFSSGGGRAADIAEEAGIVAWVLDTSDYLVLSLPHMRIS